MDRISDTNYRNKWLRLTIAAALLATATFAYASLRAAHAETVTQSSGNSVKPVKSASPAYGIDPGIFRAIPGRENIDPHIFRTLDRDPDIDRGIIRDPKVVPAPSPVKSAKTAKVAEKDLTRPRSE